MAYLTENELEDILEGQFRDLGYQVTTDDEIGPSARHPERETLRDVVLWKRVNDALRRLNPRFPQDALDAARRELQNYNVSGLLPENRRMHALMTNGVEVEFANAEGRSTFDNVRLVDFNNVENNDWLVVRQMTVSSRIPGSGVTRRPDMVVYLNGLPVAVIELKATGGQGTTLLNAYRQLQTYKNEIPALFGANVLLVTSDGMNARVGSLSSQFERFMRWRTVDGTSVTPIGSNEQDTLAKGVFTKERFLDILRNFVSFADTGNELVKIVAGYHQYHAAKKAVEQTLRATATARSNNGTGHGDRKVGVIWHTQGSGKSLLMTFYAGALVAHPDMGNPTMVVITDRNDLDEQLFSTFSAHKQLLRQTPQRADSRGELQSLLTRSSGGIIFTTIQKFFPTDLENDYPMLSDRSNIVVIADEAHRTQYGFDARVDKETGAMSYGYAKYLRDALPNASFIGFTGTPVEKDDVNTPAVFGDYIDVYDIARAVEDGATVPIYYESRMIRIELDKESRDELDDLTEELLEGEDEESSAKIKAKYTTTEALVGSDERIAALAKDLVAHWERRVEAMNGKAMVVGMSRRICVKLYDELRKLRPEWHSENDNEGVMKVVMTGSASDPAEWQRHIGRGRTRRETIALRAKDPEDPLQIVIVRDMWLTGFDAPSMHTMYVDKPMKGHGLMQAIARVNRVFEDKPAGLVVDYIGIARQLKAALEIYSPGDKEQTGIDERKAVAELLRRQDIVRQIMHGFDVDAAITATPAERLSKTAEAVEHILAYQHEHAAKADTDDAKKNANRLFDRSVKGLSSAYALAATTPEGIGLRDEVGFYQYLRAVLNKRTRSDSSSSEHAKHEAIRQLVDRSVMTVGVVDLLEHLQGGRFDMSILSEEFLSELAKVPQKNLAVEALRRLLEDRIQSRERTNIVDSRRFSERLEDAISRYHSATETAVSTIEAMIELSKELQEADERGEALDLNEEELAFFRVLSSYDSAREALGDENIVTLARQVAVELKRNISVDWVRRERARARLRTTIRRVLRKAGYPPDKSKAAVRTVIEQAEALALGFSEEQLEELRLETGEVEQVGE